MCYRTLFIIVRPFSAPMWLMIGALLLHAGAAKAQLCSNTVGDPIINVTFGTKDAPQQPNQTTFSSARGCPAKGQYSVNDFLFGCGGLWVPMTGDHTPDDLNGNYMLVNAENTPGILHIDTALFLCSGTSYQYSAFITNVMQDGLTCAGSIVLPTLTFSIEDFDGNVLAEYTTPGIPVTNEKKWVQHGFTFQLPPNHDKVILRLSANAQSGCGNAFAIDDITFATCGPAVEVTIDGSKDDQNVCANYANAFLMTGTYTAGFADPAVQWQNSNDNGITWQDIPGATIASYRVPRRQSGVILYRMVVAEKANINSANCRIRSNTIYTEIHPVPPNTPPQMIQGCSGRDYLLPKSNAAALSIEWQGPNGYYSSQETGNIPVQATVANLQKKDTGLYTLRQLYNYGCTTLDSFYLNIYPGTALTVQPSHPICEGESQTLMASATGNVQYKWSPAAGLSSDVAAAPVARPADSTIYKVVITNEFGCQDSAFLPVYVYKKPVAVAGADKVILSGDSTTLNGMVKGTAVAYYWLPSADISDVNATAPVVYPAQSKTYTLRVASTVGCGTATDEVEVKVYSDLFIPNAFTPNADGKNDRFRILPLDNYTVEKLFIYNRWGSLVYRATDVAAGWDGTLNGLPQASGAYLYHLELRNKQGEKINRNGTVYLLR